MSPESDALKNGPIGLASTFTQRRVEIRTSQEVLHNEWFLNLQIVLS